MTLANWTVNTNGVAVSINSGELEMNHPGVGSDAHIYHTANNSYLRGKIETKVRVEGSAPPATTVSGIYFMASLTNMLEGGGGAGYLFGHSNIGAVENYSLYRLTDGLDSDQSGGPSTTSVRIAHTTSGTEWTDGVNHFIRAEWNCTSAFRDKWGGNYMKAEAGATLGTMSTIFELIVFGTHILTTTVGEGLASHQQSNEGTLFFDDTKVISIA